MSPARKINGEAPSISDASVKSKTGKSWRQWFAILDKAGADEMSHPEIAAYVHETHGCSGWWSQMIAVHYEQARGLRLKHERTDGFQVSKTKMIAAPLTRLYDAWQDGRLRARWLTGGKLTVSSSTRNKVVRGEWSDGKTRVEVNFYPKGAGKSQVTVQHSKLADSKAAERMQDYWSARLERLKDLLED